MLGDHFTMMKNAESLDTNVTKIRQVTALLVYEELQILEVIKNTLPKRLYWVLFSIEDLRLAVETAKRILTKEKIDRQLSGQSGTSAPFMKVGESHKTSNKKAVSFNTQERTDKIHRLTSLVNEMKVKKEKCDVQFKPQIYQKKKKRTE